jgi:hypothetical protein
MDPVSLLAAATAAFNGIKKAVEIGREVQDVYGELGKWASAAGNLQAFINQERVKPPGIFEQIGFNKSETAEAFDVFAAQIKIREMEGEIYHMFLYGALNHLGLEGYREFIQLRKKVREDREALIKDQMRRREMFFYYAFWGSLLVIAIGVAVMMFTGTFNLGREAGKW